MTTLTSFNKTDLIDDHLAADYNRLLAGSGLALLVNTETISATKELADVDCQFQVITPSGATRTIELAPEGTNNHVTVIYNTATAQNLVIKDDSGATTFVTLLPDQYAICYPVYGERWIVLQSQKLEMKITGQQGFGDNYVITPSIASNNLTVALKTINATDPDTGDIIPFRVADTRRELSAALSVTVNAGTSVFNAGATEFATKKVQLFVYIGWRVSNTSLFIGISRIAHGFTYADFSATSTNEKYLAYSGSAPASTDRVEVIGRIDVQNSGTASYNWSLPSGAQVYNRPIFETDWLTYLPTYTATGSMTFTSVTTTQAVYKIQRDMMTVSLDVNGTTGGTASYAIRATPPIKMNASTMPGIPYMPCYIIDTTKPGGYLRYAPSSFDGIEAERLDETAWGLGAGRYFRGTSIYAI